MRQNNVKLNFFSFEGIRNEDSGTSQCLPCLLVCSKNFKIGNYPWGFYVRHVYSLRHWQLINYSVEPQLSPGSSVNSKASCQSRECELEPQLGQYSFWLLTKVTVSCDFCCPPAMCQQSMRKKMPKVSCVKYWYMYEKARKHIGRWNSHLDMKNISTSHGFWPDGEAFIKCVSIPFKLYRNFGCWPLTFSSKKHKYWPWPFTCWG